MPLPNFYSAFLLALFLSAGHPLHGQLFDDFSDGDFTNNPTWVGDTGLFQVNADGLLQLSAPDAGTARLSTQFDLPDSAVWRLRVRLEFAPSSSNLLRIYLMAEQAGLLTGDGYFLEIGENGNFDAIRLFRQDGGMPVFLAGGPAGFVAQEPVDLILQIKRSAQGQWTVSANADGGAFTPQFQVDDSNYDAGPGKYFGIYCLYTVTRRDRFYFDDISVEEDVPDTVPPVLLKAEAIGKDSVMALFNEDLDPMSALDPANYVLVGWGEAAFAGFGLTGRRQVVLTFPFTLDNGMYTLETDQIADTSGNVSGMQQAVFQYVKTESADEFDILINEIMADPSPGAGLPEVEWLELYNRSGKILALQTLFLSDGGTPQPLPAFSIQPGSFVVLGNTAAAAALAPFAPGVLAMPGFPTLNNDGETLTLTNALGAIIDQVQYSITWHNQNDKRNGGWSLERRNPNLPCLAGENWQSCPVLPGGTPGLPNASLQLVDDEESPSLLSVFPQDALTLELTFSEGLDRSSAEDIAAYSISPSRNIGWASLDAADRSKVSLYLAEPLVPGVVYGLALTEQLTDCRGNQAVTTDTVFLGLPEVPDAGDIVINEVLFNPDVGGVDFVEFYNRSSKILNWSEFFIANFKGATDVKQIAVNRLFLPGQYVVFTSNPADILSRFALTDPASLQQQILPSLPDDQGNITLYWSRGGQVVTVDSFDYNESFHNPLLSRAEREGVSLERIRAERPTNDASNWTSAARTSLGHGTPTQPNSQSQATGVVNDNDLVVLSADRLSPDGDGWEDFLDIQYHLPGAGYFATLMIFDAGGVPVKQLTRQSLVGATGALRWDGDLDDGTLARPGIYVLYLEFFSPSGDVKRVKRPVAVVRRF